LIIGADSNTSNRTPNTRKLASIVAPEFTNGRSIEILNFDSQSSATGVLAFGGRVGGSQFAATALSFNTQPNTSTTGGTVAMYINGSQNVGIGTTAPTAKLHAISTTEQFRSGFDASNYWNATTGATGLTTFNAVGSGAGFKFSDNVELTQTVTTEALVSDRSVTVVINGTTYKLLAKA